MIDKIIDHLEETLALSPSALRGKPNWETLLTAFAAQNQDIEEAAIDLILLRTIDNGTGKTLDVIGKIVGRPRAGLTDEVYKLYLRAQIAVNKSTGTREELLNICVLIVNDAALSIVATQWNYMTITLRLEGVVTTATVNSVLISLLKRAAAGGERVLLQPRVADDEYTLGSVTTQVTAFTIAGDGKYLGVASTAGFADAGTVLLGVGAASEEPVTYTHKTETTFRGMGAHANVHTNGELIQQYGPELGLEDYSAPGTGGVLATILK